MIKLSNMYHILTRYEYYSREGIKWTEWMKDNNIFNSKDEANTMLKNLKEKTKDIDKATKLKHEFKTEEIKD